MYLDDKHGLLADAWFVGITVFDISDLDNVQYCFVVYHRMGSEREVPLMTPLSAQVYLEAYHDIETEERFGLKPLLSSFKPYTLISASALKGAWPQGEWLDPKSSETDSTIDTGPQGQDEAGNKGTARVNNSRSMVTLRDRSMDTLLDTLLIQREEDTNVLADAELLPDFIPRLRQKLYEQAVTLEPSVYNLALLRKSLEKDTVLDLSPFQNFKAQDLVHILAQFRGTSRTLNLSNKSDLGESDLQTILNAGGKGLRALVVLECPKISLDFVKLHLGGLDVYHSGLFRRALGTDASDHSLMEFPSLETITQIVLIGISQYDLNTQKYHQTGNIDWTVLEKRRPFEILPIDVPLTTSKGLFVLARILWWLVRSYSSSPNYPGGVRNGVACCLASTTNGSEASVGPLSPYMHCFEHNLTGRSTEPINSDKTFEKLQTNKWAMVFIHEAHDAFTQKEFDEEQDYPAAFEDPAPDASSSSPDTPKKKYRAFKRVRYALVKKLPTSGSGSKPFLVADVPQYLADVVDGRGEVLAQRAKAFSAWWRDGVDVLNKVQVGFYDDEDIHEALEKVYRDKM